MADKPVENPEQQQQSKLRDKPEDEQKRNKPEGEQEQNNPEDVQDQGHRECVQDQDNQEGEEEQDNQEGEQEHNNPKDVQDQGNQECVQEQDNQEGEEEQDKPEGEEEQEAEDVAGVTNMADLDSIGVTVELHVYDLTKGLAAMMSSMLIGKHLPGIWHTGIVAYGREYYFGNGGVQSVRPSSTNLGPPDRVITLGDSFIPYQVFLDYIIGLRNSSFRAEDYDLFRHNCNSFSNELSNFLCGTSIPKYILDLPEEILNTPLGATLRPLLHSLTNQSRRQSLSNNPAADLGILSFLAQDPSSPTQRSDRGTRDASPQEVQLNTDQLCRTNRVTFEEPSSVDRSVKKEKKKRRKKDKRRSSSSTSTSEDSVDFAHIRMAESENASQNGASATIEEEEEMGAAAPAPSSDSKPSRNVEKSVADLEEEERKEEEAKKKQREPPIIFRTAIDLQVEFDGLVDLVGSTLNPDEQQSLEELHQYMLEDEGSWALGDGFLNFVGRILHDKNLRPEARVRILNVLAVAALKDDVILLLHQDRREHILMNYAQDVDRLELEEQMALALFMANLFENVSSSEWLLYISEWQFCNNTLSNIRVTTKVAVNCLLSENKDLQDRGSAILHNLACKEVFDDVAVELTMALLQYFNSNPPEEFLYRCMKALHRFCQISQQDVPQLVQMIGPDPSKFKGASDRVDKLIVEIQKKLR